MKTNYVLAGVGLWLGCGLVGYGLMFGFYQGEFPVLAERGYWEDVVACAPPVLAGPINLAAALTFLASHDAVFKHGFKWF